MASESIDETMDIIIYSDDKTVRAAIIEAVGVRAGKGLPTLKWDEAATAHGLQIMVHEGNYPVAIVDGEATKISGLVIAKTIADEEDNVPLFVALTARPQDEWLAEFSGITATIQRPFHPIEVQETIASVIRKALLERK
ncbi:MAG: hypothetical protein Q4P66_09350 [Actinomycetaceae bacterium]|nr:hypothetical protein [Actinomycetaceae bacterium]